MSQTEADNTGSRGTDEGGKLKEAGTTHWNSPNTGATNESGFTTLPGGYRISQGSFLGLGGHANFWSATEDGSSYAWRRYLGYNDSDVARYNGNEDYGFSASCVQD